MKHQKSPNLPSNFELQGETILFEKEVKNLKKGEKLKNVTFNPGKGATIWGVLDDFWKFALLAHSAQMVEDLQHYPKKMPWSNPNLMIWV